MRALIFVAVLLIAAAGGDAAAQSATEGPLAAPGDGPTPKPVKAKRRKPVKIAHHAVPKPEDGDPDPAAAGAAAPVARQPDGGNPADPVTFGMKWNGSNDSATQTRVQNYDGGAAGTGAEVGLKLHF